MELISQIKKKGHRVTQSRELICKILEDSGHAHFTVDEIYQKVIKKNTNIDLATVYRTLELLGEIGLIAHLHQAHGSGIYFLKNNENTMHIICINCNKILDELNISPFLRPEQLSIQDFCKIAKKAFEN